MSFSLRTLLLIVGVAAIATTIAINYWPIEVYAPPPRSVLEQLDARFNKIKSSMNEDEALVALGLGRHKSYLSMTATMWGGMSGFHLDYRLGQPGYSLEMVDRMDGTGYCRLKTPKNPDWLETVITPKPDA